VTLRNRELLNLFVVGIITSLGFASVYIARQEVVSTASLSYALFFFGLYVAAHVVARVTVPQTDPYLLPLAGLLTAFGVTEIYRLDPDNAFRQGLWIVVGVAAFSATLILLRHDFRRLRVGQSGFARRGQCTAQRNRSNLGGRRRVVEVGPRSRASQAHKVHGPG